MNAAKANPSRLSRPLPSKTVNLQVAHEPKLLHLAPTLDECMLWEGSSSQDISTVSGNQLVISYRGCQKVKPPAFGGVSCVMAGLEIVNALIQKQ